MFSYAKPQLVVVVAAMSPWLIGGLLSLCVGAHERERVCVLVSRPPP